MEQLIVFEVSMSNLRFAREIWKRNTNCIVKFDTLSAEMIDDNKYLVTLDGPSPKQQIVCKLEVHGCAYCGGHAAFTPIEQDALHWAHFCTCGD